MDQHVRKLIWGRGLSRKCLRDPVELCEQAIEKIRMERELSLYPMTSVDPLEGGPWGRTQLLKSYTCNTYCTSQPYSFLYNYNSHPSFIAMLTIFLKISTFPHNP